MSSSIFLLMRMTRSPLSATRKKRFGNPTFFGLTRVSRVNTNWGKLPALYNGVHVLVLFNHIYVAISFLLEWYCLSPLWSWLLPKYGQAKRWYLQCSLQGYLCRCDYGGYWESLYTEQFPTCLEQIHRIQSRIQDGSR